MMKSLGHVGGWGFFYDLTNGNMVCYPLHTFHGVAKMAKQIPIDLLKLKQSIIEQIHQKNDETSDDVKTLALIDDLIARNAKVYAKIK